MLQVGPLIHVLGLSVHLIKPTCNPRFRGNVSVLLHSWIEDVAHVVEVLGQLALVRPAGLGFSQFWLIFGI